MVKARRPWRDEKPPEAMERDHVKVLLGFSCSYSVTSTVAVSPENCCITFFIRFMLVRFSRRSTIYPRPLLKGPKDFSRPLSGCFTHPTYRLAYAKNYYRILFLLYLYVLELPQPEIKPYLIFENNLIKVYDHVGNVFYIYEVDRLSNTCTLTNNNNGKFGFFFINYSYFNTEQHTVYRQYKTYLYC